MNSIEILLRIIENPPSPDWGETKDYVKRLYELELEKAFLDGQEHMKDAIVNDKPQSDYKTHLKKVRDVY